MTTIKDIARESGVSIGTVSNYLNGTKHVSQQTSHKIRAAIDKLGYIQNYSAKSLKSKKYNTIGIILPNFNDPYYVQIFQGIEMVFQNTDYLPSLALSYDIPQLEKRNTENLLKIGICALILVPCQQDNMEYYYKNFSSQNKPLVLIDRRINMLETNFISFNNSKTIEHMTDFLINKGLYDNYLIVGPKEFECETQCIKGFVRSMRKINIDNIDDRIISCDFSKEGAFKAASNLFLQSMPQAIVTSSENLAAGIIECMSLLGLSLNDIPVLTLGEEHWNKNTHSMASLSSMRPAISMGRKAAQILLKQLKSPLINENTQLILRDKINDIQLSDIKFKSHKQYEKKKKNNQIIALMLETSQVKALCTLLRNFETKSGIKVKIKTLPHHQLYDQIINNQDKNFKQRADVLMYDIPWLSSLAYRGLLANITQMVKSSKNGANNFLGGTLNPYGHWNGQDYGMPFMYAPQIFYYRKDLFENNTLQQQFERRYNSRLRPPLTWKEYNAITEFFTCETNAVAYGSAIPAAYAECLSPELYVRFFSYGVKVIDKNNHVTLNSPQALKAFINIKKAFKYAKPDYLNATDTSVVNDFRNGKTAMLITYPSFINTAYFNTNRAIGNIGYTKIPGRTPILGGWGLGISSHSKNKQAAYKFIEWACGSTISNYFALLGCNPAVEKMYTNDELIKLYPWLPLYRSVYKSTRTIKPPKPIKDRAVPQSAIDEILYEQVINMITKDVDPGIVLLNTTHKLKELLEN